MIESKLLIDIIFYFLISIIKIGVYKAWNFSEKKYKIILNLDFRYHIYSINYQKIVE
jgi:hypothetical protein